MSFSNHQKSVFALYIKMWVPWLWAVSGSIKIKLDLPNLWDIFVHWRYRNWVSLTLKRPSISLFIATLLSKAVYCITQFQICFNLSPKSFDYSYLVIFCKNFLFPSPIDVRFCCYINMQLGTTRHFIHCFCGAFASKSAMLPWGLTSTAQWCCCSLVFLFHSHSLYVLLSLPIFAVTLGLQVKMS